MTLKVVPVIVAGCMVVSVTKFSLNPD
jgi:hypothetical protein